MSDTASAPVTEPTELDVTLTDEAVCPFCGEEQGDSWELGGGRKDHGETECASCGQRFCWSRDVSVSYSTRKP